MRYVAGLTGILLAVTLPVKAAPPLFVAYPPNNHETTARQIFLIGTAPPQGEVQVNGQPIARNRAGNFAPSFPLQLGENRFTLRYQEQEITLRVVRVATEPPIPTGLAFAQNSLTPAVDIARLPNEWICFGAIAPPNATVEVKLADQILPLKPGVQLAELPSNLAVLTNQNQPATVSAANRYRGCTRPVVLGDLGIPQFQLTIDGQTTTQPGTGKISILSPANLEVAEVTTDAGVARTGPSTDHSRLTPLPKGTRATITGIEGDWLRLDYGGWIRRQEVRVVQASVPPRSIIRSITSRQRGNWTEVSFPLEVPVPVRVHQTDRTLTLTLHNTTAQTDIIRLDDNPIVQRLDWQQVNPDQVQYTFNFKTPQQWGYRLRYEGTSLILSLRHSPPVGASDRQPLQGITILLDPGHGGPEDLGARGPNGYPEKEVALLISKRVRDELLRRGAKVVMTREDDRDVPLQERVALINQTEPAIALSLHYNALPDDGDALKTKGISTFWYNAQAHSLAVFLHNHLTRTLNRPSYGVFWNNLALTRPTVAPAVLLELGFMIHPDEFEWITNPQEQSKLATAIADGITLWFRGGRE